MISFFELSDAAGFTPTMKSQPSAINKITINAAEQDSRIHSVTVFQSNHAEVKRRVNVELKQGQNHVHIERLPSLIVEDSIRVEGTGSAVIFDVVYHAPTQKPSSFQAVVTANQSLLALQKERSIVQEEFDFLGSYGRSLDSKSVNIDDVQRFLDMYTPRQIAVAKRIQGLDTKIAIAQIELRKAQRQTYTDRQGENRGTKVTVTVLSETDHNAELTLTYVVSDARWTPLYDLRASIAKSPTTTSTVSLHYRASITQTTGENWPDVALTLSTASPQLGSQAPTLSSWRVGFPAPPVAPPPTLRTYAPIAPLGSEATNKLRALPRMCQQQMQAQAQALVPPAQPMEVRRAHVASAGVLSATFGISGRSNIPSDPGSHKAVIALLDLEAALEWICVPRQKESVFLMCKMVNSSDFTLLPGEANVFMDDNFVSKSRIEHVAPNDSFKVSLGVDSALRVTYPSAKTHSRTTTQSSLAFVPKEKQTVTAQSQRIIIRNSRPSLVSGLRVLDHVPISTDARIQINVIAPSGLGAISPSSEISDGKEKERPWINVQKGTEIRWAPLDAGGEGAVEWSCDIAPTEELELELVWEISAPVGQTWKNL